MDLAAFEGRWRIAREIEDRRNGLSGRFEGEAVFAPEPGRFSYRETGVMRFGTAVPMVAERAYRWSELLGMIEIRFEDGRFFHAFDPLLARPTAHHDCPPDSYDVSYDFTGGPAGGGSWTSRWQVNGPRKAHVILSQYMRVG